MNQQDDSSQPSAPQQRTARGKMIFLAVVAVAVVVIYISQQSGVELPDWPGDVDKALAQGKSEDRRILLFFAGKSPSEEARWMSRKTLAKNRSRIKKDKLICVLVRGGRNTETAKRYKVSALPTFILLDPQGNELNRRIGRVGEVAFRDGFLDCSDVKKP